MHFFYDDFFFGLFVMLFLVRLLYVGDISNRFDMSWTKQSEHVELISVISVHRVHFPIIIVLGDNILE